MKWEAEYYITRHSADGEYNVYDTDSGLSVAMVDPLGELPYAEKACALIAAAPDLLAALKTLRDAIPPTIQTAKLGAAYVAAVTAIKKAEGAL